MRKLLFLLSIFAIVLSCSSDETSTPVTPPPAPIAKYTITLSAGEGGTVSTTGGEYEAGRTVSVTATPQGEYLFKGWSDGNTNATRTITVNSNTTLTANFEKKKYPLTVNIEGEGEVLEEIVNSGRTTDYDSGTTVKLTAVPAEGWEFVGWTGAIESSELEVQLLVSEAKEVNAEFISEYSYKGISNDYFSLNSVNNRLPYLFKEFVWTDFFPEAMIIFDYNNDGNLDFIDPNTDVQNSILGNRIRRNMKFYLGDEKGNLIEDIQNKDKFLSLIHTRKSIIGDFNGDGFMDIFFASTGPDSNQPNYIPNDYILMLINDKNGSFVEFRLDSNYGVADGYWHSVTASDIDNDNKPEIILINPKGPWGNISRIIEFEGDTGGNWNNGLVISEFDISVLDAYNKFTSESIDLNNDGNIKLILGGHQVKHPNDNYDGTGSFSYDLVTKEKIEIKTKNDLLIDVVFFDIDNDGDLDLLCSTNTTYLEGKIEIFRNDTNSFTDVTDTYIDENYDYENHNMQWIQWLYLGDFNGDGIIELHTSDSRDKDIALNSPTKEVWWFENNKFIKKSK